jgi:hypothetical protein
MTSADGHAGSLGDSSTGTPARGLQHGDSIDTGSAGGMTPSVVGVGGGYSSGVSQSVSSRPLPFASGVSLQVRFFFAAGVLLLAVSAKVQWILSNPLWEDIAIGGMWVTLAAIVLEAWTASSLLLLPNRRQAAWIGLAVHVVLLVASVWFWISGLTCQCFGDWALGDFQIPTWALPAYNLVAVVLFGLIAAKFDQATTAKAWLRLPDLGTQIGVVIGLFFGLFMLSTSQGQQFWRPGAAANEVILQVGELPELVPGESYETGVTLYNRLSKPIRVVGGGTSCTCVTLENIPLEIPANSRRELAVRFQVGEHLRGQKEFTSSLVYYLKGGQQFLVRSSVKWVLGDTRR